MEICNANGAYFLAIIRNFLVREFVFFSIGTIRRSSFRGFRFREHGYHIFEPKKRDNIGVAAIIEKRTILVAIQLNP